MDIHYFYYIYKWMVVDALARPAQADIQAGWRTGCNKIDILCQSKKNLSGMQLSSSGNSATIYAIVMRTPM
jgi:hypothetical protein